jgi:hypothetical protein
MNTNTQKSAFQITAKVNGKTWLNKSTTLTAENEQEAINKAKKVLNLTDEHEINVEAVTVYASTEKLTATNYPYGSLRATAFFSVESNKKGFRTIFQTINPKTNRINNPKKSTYYAVILPMQKGNGHFDFCGYTDMNGGEEINKACQFISDFYDLFTKGEIEQIALHMLTMLQVHTKAICIYCGTNFEDLKPFIDTQVKTAVEIAKNKENLFLSCMLDNEKIDSLKVPDFNPFTVKSVSVGV